jgi:transglutaminase-like putative cysteine protease
LLAHIAQLDEEELLFLDSIKNDTPKQQLIKIEQYVRKHSFYDKNNNDVANLKAKKSIDEKMYVCKKRIDELKEKKIEISSELEDKKRAGVCADFATITIAMLRQAGFLSGVISGFMSS